MIEAVFQVYDGSKYANMADAAEAGELHTIKGKFRSSSAVQSYAVALKDGMHLMSRATDYTPPTLHISYRL